MTVNNKLKIAILAILSSQSLYAITFDPLQIQSAPGELLYAEMSFHQADSNARLEVSLATPDDLRMLGATHQPPAHLNFLHVVIIAVRVLSLLPLLAQCSILS